MRTRSQEPVARSQKLAARIWALVLGVIVMAGVVVLAACESRSMSESASLMNQNAELNTALSNLRNSREEVGLDIAGSNTYSGATTVSSGNLIVSGGTLT